MYKHVICIIRKAEGDENEAILAQCFCIKLKSSWYLTKLDCFKVKIFIFIPRETTKIITQKYS